MSKISQDKTWKLHKNVARFRANTSNTQLCFYVSQECNKTDVNKFFYQQLKGLDGHLNRLSYRHIRHFVMYWLRYMRQKQNFFTWICMTLKAELTTFHPPPRLDKTRNKYIYSEQVALHKKWSFH